MTVRATGDYKLLRVPANRSVVHKVSTTAKWLNGDCTGGFGSPNTGYKAVCGAIGPRVWEDETDLPLCPKCGEASQ